MIRVLSKKRVSLDHTQLYMLRYLEPKHAAAAYAMFFAFINHGVDLSYFQSVDAAQVLLNLNLVKFHRHLEGDLIVWLLFARCVKLKIPRRKVCFPASLLGCCASVWFALQLNRRHQ